VGERLWRVRPPLFVPKTVTRTLKKWYKCLAPFLCNFCTENFSLQYLMSILAMRTEMHVCRHTKRLVLSIIEMC